MLRRYQAGPVTPGPFAFSYIGGMTFLLLTLVVLQAPTTAVVRPFAYRGFSPGMPYRVFAERARLLSIPNETFACQTMRQTAQVMDCGVRMRDPADSAPFYLSANVIEGRTSVISFVDSGKVALVARAQTELRNQLGTPQRRERSMWEWTTAGGRRFIRLNWRGGRGWRVISITLNDRDVLKRIANYVPKARRPPRPPRTP